MIQDSDQQRHDEFLRLFSRHSRRIYNFIFTLVMSHADAEEIFQDTCVLLWKKFDSYDPQGNFPAWACKMATYEVLQLRRKSKRLLLVGDETLKVLADQAIAHSDSLDARQHALEHCVEKLPDHDKALIEQRYRQQLTPKEMAASLSRSVYSVYRALTRVHSALMKCVTLQVADEK
ncbi:sigma-70 family RNA polymerase sigma factor [Aeoliella sp. ICT_H6.2]|uniref:Sigma-70 family RNA polymerase sigma factor n=1 Tax=Aeoliella straminimaris TaxID=2954799 RepID=A0A9X2FHA5_9BACT|nr:sigma-70 family RNA polymerase sigma factor [Aeoliella straminimaris]MCO6044656.1 sigma-70 family RNA polymerase sigma factor [Aeoliella straminimaris]